MSTITYSSTPVKTADATAPDATRIDIHERMISPYADRERALWVVQQLRDLGWPARYQAMKPQWQFAGYEDAARFHSVFGSLLKSAAPAFVWPVYIDEETDGTPDRAATVVQLDIDMAHLTPWENMR